MKKILLTVISLSFLLFSSLLSNNAFAFDDEYDLIYSNKKAKVDRKSKPAKKNWRSRFQREKNDKIKKNKRTSNRTKFKPRKKVQPKPVAKPRPKKKVKARAKPRPKKKIKARAKPRPKKKIKARAKPRPKKKVKARAKPRLKKKVKARAKPRPKKKVKARAKPQSKPKTKTKDRAKPQPKPRIKARAKPQPGPKIKPHVKPKPKPKAKAKPRPKPVVRNKPKPPPKSRSNSRKTIQARNINGEPVNLFAANKELDFIEADLSSIRPYVKTNARRPAPSISKVSSLYQTLGGAKIFTNESGLNAKGRDLLNFVNLSIGKHGLYPNEYLKTINSSGGNKEHQVAKAYLKLAKDITVGRLIPDKADTDWFIKQPDISYEKLLKKARDSSSISGLLKGLFPQHKVYRSLVKALDRVIKKNNFIGSWPSFPAAGPKLNVGTTHKHVALLRERLFASGHLANNSGSDTFDRELKTALSKFQKESGLNADGVVGRRTRISLAKSSSQHTEQIMASLERFRWLPHNMGNRFIIVNTAGYELNVLKNDGTALNMRIVVGKKKQGKKNHETPSFNRNMKYIVVNPKWNVPASIASKELLLHAQKDPQYFKKRGYSVYSSKGEIDSTTVNWNSFKKGQRLPLNIVQNPSNTNALGKIKFMFPNKYSIYLHDTPQKALFARDRRSFSHGCVRLSKPINLATNLLGKSTNEIKKMISSGKNQTIHLDKEIPVYIVYMTAWARDNGSVVYFDDYYGRDNRMMHNFVPKS